MEDNTPETPDEQEQNQAPAEPQAPVETPEPTQEESQEGSPDPQPSEIEETPSEEVSQEAPAEPAPEPTPEPIPEPTPEPDPKSVVPRFIETHKVNGANEKLTIEVIDEPGSGGANHLYVITGYIPTLKQRDVRQDGPHTIIGFQNGPIPENGTNGLTQEALLAIVADRLECFQNGPFACDENADALAHVQEAIRILKLRTERRIARNVEGTHTV